MPIDFKPLPSAAINNIRYIYNMLFDISAATAKIEHWSIENFFSQIASLSFHTVIGGIVLNREGDTPLPYGGHTSEYIGFGTDPAIGRAKLLDHLDSYFAWRCLFGFGQGQP